MKTVRKARRGMRVVGDPVKHQSKTRALGPDNRVMYVAGEEGMQEDPENYLNLARLDSIIEGQHSGSLPFGDFRDAVRRVEAGPDSPDPYRQRQEVEVLRDGKMVTLPVGVGRGAQALRSS